jgi:hypothetical protein
MRMHSSGISIWFFIGVLLVVYGALILGYGIFELATGQLANVVLANLHAPVWWGAMLEALGLFYTIRFRPRSART